ncbi:MAG: hypothetical protein IPL46_17510 [Saprospiraceae bacterium]|nr:hypothetical protein [Saprospiraceae bacterium]
MLVQNSSPGNEAIRIQGTSMGLTFYDVGLYDGYLFNHGGNIRLGTSQSNLTGRLSFHTQALERMTIKYDGFVGIGTISPSYQLDVQSSGIAIYGRSTADAGLYGYSEAVTGIYGYSNALSSNGILGQSAFIGVQGITNAPGMDVNRQAVRGDNHGSNTGYASYFFGNAQVTGTLSKGTGSFKIDHPMDPENKYLYHSFVESPDMKNLHDGIVTTDASGDAEMTLPDWFMALSRDFRYQLTVINQFA